MPQGLTSRHTIVNQVDPLVQLPKLEGDQTMSPNEPLKPIDPPDNTGGGSNLDADPDTADAQPRKIDPPDNTGGG